MCQKITILTEISHTRYVSQCEHGTVHLLWDAVGLHLTEAGFRRLAEHMHRTWETRQRTPHLLTTKMWLKVAQIELHIEAFEFAEILEMVQTSIRRLDEEVDHPLWAFTAFRPRLERHFHISAN